MIIPNIWENKKCSKPPTSYAMWYLPEDAILNHQWWYSPDHLAAVPIIPNIPAADPHIPQAVVTSSRFMVGW